jgi:hypothetical protein
MKRPEFLDLEKDLPTTPEDIAALRRAREPTPMDMAHYIRALSRLKLPHQRRRQTHEGFEPFTLET